MLLLLLDVKKYKYSNLFQLKYKFGLKTLLKNEALKSFKALKNTRPLTFELS